MNCVVQIIFVLEIFLKISSCFELFDESAWNDRKEKDNFFDYKELKDITTEIKEEIKKFSNNIDFELFGQSSHLEQPEMSQNYDHIGIFENQNRHLSPNVLDFFLGSIKNVIKSNQQYHHQNFKHIHINNNETTKGIDIAIDSNMNVLPSFGNKQDLKFIFLGTKWCGSGDNAKNLNDIGYFYLTDHCCREHDLCDDVIEPNGEKYGLKNPGKFTRLHCDCDNKFYKCLKRVNTLVSKQIGIFYFNILGHQCFREDHPVVSCSSKSKGRCIEFTRNMKISKMYQWFDNRWF